jgi:methionine--tRNA ligase beta chain
MISYEEFKKVELKIGRIVEAERVEQSGKLLKLKVDLGGEVRQIIAGIGKHYEPELLISSLIVVVANLEPRVIMGLESQGMLLASSDEEKTALVLLRPEKEIVPGSLVG